MAIIWPVQLPQKLLQDGYTESDNPQVITVTYDVGEPQTRPRSQYRGRKLSGSFMITVDQLEVFDTFYNTTTIVGTQPFEFPDPITGTTINVKFDSNSPPQKGSVKGRYLNVSMQLIVQP